MEEGSGKDFLTLLKKVLSRRSKQILAVALICTALLIALSALFFRSYGIKCEEYCKSQSHVTCVGSWNISGQYPNCNCQYICWGSKTCDLDSDCQTDEKCYKSFESGRQIGDMFCHKMCEGSSDCPEVTPYCRRVNITIGSSSDLVEMCMMEECVKDSDCRQPRCIGMYAVCENSMCKIVDINGLPARCV